MEVERRLEEIKAETDKIKTEDEILTEFEYNIKNKFSGSSQATLIFLQLLNQNIIISAQHKRCDYFDTIFIDIGVAVYRRNRDIKELNFNQVVLELHCDTDHIQRYYISKSDLLKYINLEINDPEFISLIKAM